MASAMNQTDARNRMTQTDANGALDWRSRPRRNHTVEQKRVVVAECRVPGASLSSVALRHGMNANMVRKWVVQEQAGTLVAAKRGRKPSVLPVVLSGETCNVEPIEAAKRRDLRVEIETSRGVMRVVGEVDAAMMDALLTAMLR